MSQEQLAKDTAAIFSHWQRQNAAKEAEELRVMMEMYLVSILIKRL